MGEIRTHLPIGGHLPLPQGAQRGPKDPKLFHEGPRGDYFIVFYTNFNDTQAYVGKLPTHLEIPILGTVLELSSHMCCSFWFLYNVQTCPKSS